LVSAGASNATGVRGERQQGQRDLPPGPDSRIDVHGTAPLPYIDGGKNSDGAEHGRWPGGVLLAVPLLVGCAIARAGDTGQSTAAQWLATVRPSPPLQAFLDRTMDELEARDPRARAAAIRVAVLDLAHGEPPRLAHRDGDAPIYPASVVKFVYLMAAYRWQADGRLRIEGDFDRQLSEMIRESSNEATQKVFRRLTDTAPGPELPPESYRDFCERRQAVKRWLATLGVADLHCVNPTYDGGGDLYGRDAQFIRDPSIPGGLGRGHGEAPNRQAMTANGTVRLLALLATDRALSAEDSATVRRRMRRDPREQPHSCIASPAARPASRSRGLREERHLGPIYADAGIVRQPDSGRQVVIAVFTEATPAYRGELIADLTERVVRHVFDGER
jgi:beta-lactamase class A